MAENCRLAGENCIRLAISPYKGKAYDDFWNEIESLVGCCRQAAAWRQDARWYTFEEWLIGVRMRSGRWLRGVKVGPGPSLRIPQNEIQTLFLRVAHKLAGKFAEINDMRDKATGRLGMILPKPVETFRETRQHRVADLPQAMRKAPSGLIVPSGIAAQ